MDKVSLHEVSCVDTKNWKWVVDIEQKGRSVPIWEALK